MAQAFDTGLNSKIKEFARKFGIISEVDEADLFEDFANYVIASNLLEGELENIKSVSTNKAQGIDGIVIVVNNRLVSEESDLEKFGQMEPLKIKFGFIQSTIQSSFDGRKLGAFTDNVVNFLVGVTNIEPYSTIYKKLLGESSGFIDMVEDTPHISLFFLSARTAHTITDEVMTLEKNKINGRTELRNNCFLDKFVFLQKDEIKNYYDRIAKFHTVQLKFDNNVQLSPVSNVEMSLLATIKFSELRKLILTSDNNLKERLFIENVRNYLGETPVNTDIKKTLDTVKELGYFPFLNNGLAIICEKIERHPVRDKTFFLTFPRIINGCQTTNELFKKYKSTSGDIDDVEIVAKIISTKDNDLKKMIIYAANNQNSIEKDLQLLSDFHEKIETCFSGKDEGLFHLYFERLRGQHTNVAPPYSKINIETLARIFISVFWKKPHEMKSSAVSVIRTFQRKGQIFNNSTDDVDQYYYCAVLWYWFNHLLVNGEILMRSKTMDMHILMACNILLEQKGYNSIEEKLSFLKEENNAKSLFCETTAILNSNSKDYLFDRRGFYSNPKTERLIREITNGTN